MLDFHDVKRQLDIPAQAPLHVRLRNAIQDQISSGTLAPGAALPPERELQDRLGISRSTIRQALRALVEAGVLKSVIGSGNYVQARPIASPGRPLIGVVMPTAGFNVYYAQLASTLNNSLRAAGFRVDMSMHNQSMEHLAEIVESLLAHNVVALALSPIDDERMLPMLESLKANRVATVMIARYLDFPGIDYIGADNERIGYDATRHLIEIGHRQIVHFSGLYGSTGRDRAKGYVRAMQEWDLEPCIAPTDGEDRHISGLPEFAPHIDHSPKCGDVWRAIAERRISAAFCFNDETAGWVQKELRKLHLAIPDALSIVGVDNLPYARFFDAPLTTFELPGEDIGLQAADRLVRRLNGDTSPAQRILVSAKFIHRQSTTPVSPAETLPRVALAGVR